MPALSAPGMSPKGKAPKARAVASPKIKSPLSKLASRLSKGNKGANSEPGSSSGAKAAGTPGTGDKKNIKTDSRCVIQDHLTSVSATGLGEPGGKSWERLTEKDKKEYLEQLQAMRSDESGIDPHRMNFTTEQCWDANYAKDVYQRFPGFSELEMLAVVCKIYQAT